jgi:predicted metal-dependent phosphotriesterase family hydrolase
VAATGFHRRRYYPPDAALFTASVDQACQLFMNELTQNLHETRSQPQPVRAGFIKIAFEASLQDTPLHLAEAAVLASHETDSAVEVHTEKGAAAEEIARFLLDAGLPASRLILCHMDKRPDFDLHSSLAEAGIALEYDTFLRPHYRPDDHVWPLLARMIGAGLEDYVILATDMADIRLWSQAAGAAALPTSIVPRLRQMGLAPGVIQKLTGLNIARRLARRDSAGIL